MTIPQNTAAQAALAAEYEAARNAFGRAQAEATGGAVLRDGELEVWAGPFQHPYHGWMSAPFPGERAEASLTAALRLYRRLRTTMFVPLGPATRDDAAMRRELRARGFRCSYHVSVMHLDLRGWARPTGPLPGGRVERVGDWSLFESQPHPTLGRAATALGRARLAFYRSEATAENPRFWQWVARQKERVVGGVALFRHADTVLVIDMVVNAECRGRGLGTALMIAACRHAQELGLRAAVLSASARGVGFYSKLGFADAGTWSHFVLSGQRLARLRLE